jgi:phosphatidylglycerol lysyltransferase
MTLANGVVNILTGLLVRFHTKPYFFGLVLPPGVYYVSRLVVLVLGLVLIYLSLNVFQRRKVAWPVTLGVLAVGFWAHLGKGHLWYAALAPLAAIVLLVLARKSFTVRSEPRSLAQGLILMGVSVLTALVYGVFGFWLLDRRDFGIEFNFANAIDRTLREFLLVGNADITAHTRHATWFLNSFRVLGVAAVTTGLYSIFRPIAYRLQTLPEERRRAEEILKRYGTSSIDFFKLWPEKSYFFSPGQDGFIAYRVAGSFALVLGDPAAPEGEMKDLVTDFLALCSDNGWRAAFILTFHPGLPELLELYKNLGLRQLKIGKQAIIDLERFALKTVQKKAFRRVLNRFDEAGYVLTRHAPPHGRQLLDDLESISNEWLTLPGRRERGFALGHFDRDYLHKMPVYVVRDGSGAALAFVNQIPSFRQGEATIDLMRHRAGMPNGTMDFLFARLMLAFRSEGFTWFDLGLAPMSPARDVPAVSLRDKVTRQVYTYFRRIFFHRFAGLYNYKAKFEPDWEDNFLVYQGGPMDLMRVAVALVRLIGA